MLQKVSLAESIGSLFTLKDVKWTPETPRLKDPFTITGKVDLFGIPFYLPVWAVASITYPKKLTDVIGAPVEHSTAIVFGGKFTMNFASGFDREGVYKLDLHVYIGPTYTEALGSISSSSITIPPFPSVASLPTQNFTVSGTPPPAGDRVDKQSVVYNGGLTQVNSGAQVKAVITWVNNDTVAHTEKFRLDLKKSGATHNEGTWVPSSSVDPGKTGTVTINSIPVPSDWSNNQEFTAIVVLDGADGDWDTSSTLKVAKGTGIETGNVNFTNNYPVNISVDFESYGQTPVSVNLLSGNHYWVADDGAGNQATGQITVVANQTLNVDVKVVKGGVTKTGTLKITFTPTNATVTVDGSLVTSGQSLSLQVGYHTWDFQASGYYRNNAQFLITSNQTTTIDIPGIPLIGPTPTPTPGVPTLSASYSQGVVSCSFSGFQPNATITISVTQTGGSLSMSSDGNGAGSIAFDDNDPAGTYTLQATDNYGHSAIATFTVSGGGVGSGTLYITFTPASATVTVDGNPVSNGGSYPLSTGNHTYLAQADGFYQDTGQFLITLNQTTAIYIVLIQIF